ncbi:enoyl-CoA hydratase-related protein [Frigoriglobus tundricola]|uniref:Enoyl-CoA hydratase / 3-hydroxyacyl-CoA dehydrogenase / 3-hydroxybutyryl-CoA epimerase n=1 Tax=Frigoriglobus tundricola TaxID=2774151 RepID=A0A6M5YRA5_9BACT|nr:enoyl-CoA hydratase-related protein [Frigoriglobus tundricola]QJW96585.1 Enoyl-CoA hydratase / 3-hydroxyacyl-CoA dehydrogenase / 3-hydroxybutyryl-CoA epimerase [Frigoriglobus tundricola]
MSAITVTTRPDGVAVLTFDQPGSKANVLTRDLWTEFGEALAGLAPQTDLKGLVLASAKPGTFIAGADLKLLANAPGPNDPEVRAFIEQGLRVLEQLEALPFPTCAAIDGAALGGGLEVALACDYRVCGTNPKVQLGLPEVKLGLIPGWGGTQRLPRILDRNRMHVASNLLITAQMLSHQEARAHELVDVAVDSVALVDQAVDYVLRVDGNERRERKRNPVPRGEWERFQPLQAVTGAAAEAVRVMVEGAALPLADAIQLETEAFMRLAGSDASKRLIAEFFASRKK